LKMVGFNIYKRLLDEMELGEGRGAHAPMK